MQFIVKSMEKISHYGYKFPKNAISANWEGASRLHTVVGEGHWSKGRQNAPLHTQGYLTQFFPKFPNPLLKVNRSQKEIVEL